MQDYIIHALYTGEDLYLFDDAKACALQVMVCVCANLDTEAYSFSRSDWEKREPLVYQIAEEHGVTVHNFIS